MAHHLSTEIEIQAPPQTVWEVLTDLARYADWNPFIVESAGVVAVGQRLTNRMQPPGGRAMTFRPTVTAVEPGAVFEWLGRLGVGRVEVPGLFDGRHRFELRPGPSGSTVLTQSESFSGLLVPLFRRSLEGKTLAGFEAMNQAIKARAELQAVG